MNRYALGKAPMIEILSGRFSTMKSIGILFIFFSSLCSATQIRNTQSSLNIISSCQKRYEVDNADFWPSMVKSRRNIFRSILESEKSYDENSIVSLEHEVSDTLLISVSKHDLFPLKVNALAKLSNQSLANGLEAYIRHSATFINAEILSDDGSFERFRQSIIKENLRLNLHQEDFKSYVDRATDLIKLEGVQHNTTKQVQDHLRTFASEVNELCRETKLIIRDKLGSGPYDHGTFAAWIRMSSHRRKALYDEQLAPYLQDLTVQILAKKKKLQRVNSAIASLLYTPSMRSVLPIDDNFLKNCAHPQEDTTIDILEISYKSTVYAITQMKKSIKEDLNNTLNGLAAIRLHNKVEVHEQLKNYFKYKPYLLGAHLNEIASGENKELFANYICIQTMDIYSADENWNIGTMTGGVIIGTAVGIGTAGIGAGFGTSIMAGALVTTFEGAGIYHFDSYDSDQIMTGAAVGEIASKISHQQFVELEAIASDYEFSAYMSASAVIAAPIAHGVKTAYTFSKTAKKIKPNRYIPGRAKRKLPRVTRAELRTADSKERIEAIRLFMIKNNLSELLKPNGQLYLKHKKAIISAHKVGGPNKGFFDPICLPLDKKCSPSHNFSDEDIDDKIRALRGTGNRALFPYVVRRYAIRSGKTGNKLSKAQKSKQAKHNKSGKKKRLEKENDKKAKKEESARAIIDLNIVYKALDEIKRVRCFVNSQCQDFILRVTPALEHIIKKYEEGSGIATRYMNFLKNTELSSLPTQQLTILKECLKFHNGKLSCTPKQLDHVIRFMETNWSPLPHPNFFKRILRSLGYDEFNTKFERGLRFITKEHNPNQTGSIIGRIDEVTLDIHDRPLINGKLATGKDPLVKALSIEREGQAIRLLAKLGFEVTVLPTSKVARKSMEGGVQRNFERLSELANIGKDKNPDLILDGEFIADIYSPLRDLTVNSVERVVKRVLVKTEGKNYQTSYFVDEVEVIAKGERQTNRVVIYADDYDGDINGIANKIRQEIGDNEPDHLEEAFILYKDTIGNPQIISVWP